jgi:hypothetical protein
VAQPVVHFEIIGKNHEKLRVTSVSCSARSSTPEARAAETVSEPMNYGFANGDPTSDGTGIPGGVGGGAGYDSRVIFYVGVPNVEAALQQAESLGGKRQMGPVKAPTGLVVGALTEPGGLGRPGPGWDTWPGGDAGAGHVWGHGYSTGSTAGTPSCRASSQYGPSGSTRRATRKIARGSSPGGRST